MAGYRRTSRVSVDPLSSARRMRQDGNLPVFLRTPESGCPPCTHNCTAVSLPPTRTPMANNIVSITRWLGAKQSLNKFALRLMIPLTMVAPKMTTCCLCLAFTVS